MEVSSQKHCKIPITPSIPLLNFLQLVQETALKTFGPTRFDRKIYIDLSLKFDLPKTEQAFENLQRDQNGAVSREEELESFLGEFFNGAGEDLVYVEPVDFVAEPDGFLALVENVEVREWALQVHSLWKMLSRQVCNGVWQNPELYTLIPLPKPGIIPGSRFREVYYWDSYWVIRGLLASKMHETAKSIVTNLISLVEHYGFVLNGARKYYTNRSQPPLLSSMVCEIYKRTEDLDLVKKSFPALLKEYQFWNSGIHKVIIQDSNGCNHSLSRYYAMWNKPRPEAFTVDKEFASKFLTSTEKSNFYREVASAAESGWDFSSRWMRDPSDFTTVTTTSIIPVDLNAFLLKMELDIAFLARLLGENGIAEDFIEASKAREKAFSAVFWNENMAQWLDCWIETDIASKDDQPLKNWRQNERVFASNFIPLWINLPKSDNEVEKVVKSLKNSGLLCANGIATSLTESGQQWDFPNGWAPLQHMIIEGLLSNSGCEEARSMAKDIAFKWLKTNYITFKKTGTMHEKYNVDKCGEFGGGGLYKPQTGFGWTNGVALALLEEFEWLNDQILDCE
ncbi:hypothetical protein V2J09_020105 [Rumex salicifolius]